VILIVSPIMPGHFCAFSTRFVLNNATLNHFELSSYDETNDENLTVDSNED